MDKELLYKFLRCQTTEQEEKLLADWLEADAEHRRELDAMQLTMEGMALRGPAFSGLVAQKRPGVFSLRRFALRAAAAAAMIALAAGIGFRVASDRQAGWASQMTVVEVPAGNRMLITLGDGTQVWLNAGTKLEYPSVFAEKKRHVKVSGEAMFDVAHDAARPFVVETFACDIEVLGTKFNVAADETKRSFSTALMNGSVKLSGRLAGETPITMHPNEEVHLSGGRLAMHQITDPDEYLWPEGIISISNIGFADLMVKFERVFDVRIGIECPQMPEITYGRGKIRVSDGIDHALSVLQMASDFRYEKDPDTGMITIQE